MLAAGTLHPIFPIRYVGPISVAANDNLITSARRARDRNSIVGGDRSNTYLSAKRMGERLFPSFSGSAEVVFAFSRVGVY